MSDKIALVLSSCRMLFYQAERPAELQEEIKKTVQFSLREAVSSIDGAGQGIFLDGRAEPGQIVVCSFHPTSRKFV